MDILNQLYFGWPLTINNDTLLKNTTHTTTF